MKLQLGKCAAALALFCWICAIPATAQDLPEFEIGLKPFGTYHGGDIDNVSITNGNLTLDIPLFSYPQRGEKLTKSLHLIYNNKGWRFNTHCGPIIGCITSVRGPVNGVQVVDPQLMKGGAMSCTAGGGVSGTIGIPTAVRGLGDSHAMGNTGLGYSESIDGSGIVFGWGMRMPSCSLAGVSHSRPE